MLGQPAGELVTVAVLTQPTPQDLQQQLQGEGLGQQLYRIGQTQGMLAEVAAGQYYRELGPLLVQGLDDLASVQARHREVEQGQSDFFGMPPVDLQRLDAVGRFENAIAAALEPAANQSAQDRLVVGDQDGLGA